MKKILLYILTPYLLGACNSSDETLKRVSLGDCYYSPSFLWTDEEHTYIEKKLVLDFSQAAKDESSQAKLEFVDTEGKALDLNEYEVFIDGQRLDEPSFLVNANQKEISFKIGCSQNAEEGIRSGMLRLCPGHSLDRIENTRLESPQQAAEICGWEFTFEQKMNKLQLGLLWLIGIVLSVLLLWLIVLSPIIFTRFKTIKKGVYIPGQAPINISFKGARLVVLDSKKHKQSLFDRIFKGKILYKQHPAIKTKITFKPRSKGRILVVANGAIYRVNPNPMPKIGTTTITDINNNLKITVQ